MKKCKYCEREKEIEDFPKVGLKCKECVALYKKEYALNNKEKIQEYKKEYALENKEKIQEYKKEYALENKDKLKDKRKEYYEDNKEYMKERDKEYREKNKEKINEYKYEYNRTDKIKEYHAKYREENKEKIKEKKKKYYEENSEFVKSQVKKYSEENREHVNKLKRDNRYKNIDESREKERQYVKKKKENNSLFRLTCAIRGLIKESLKNGYTKKAKKTVEILGCDFETFKEHIESQFDENMNWDNYATYWQLDHKTPVSWAKNEEEVYELNHYTNFQPLYWIDNYAKGNRWCG